MNIKLKKGQQTPSYNQLMKQNTMLKNTIFDDKQKIRQLQMQNHSMKVKLAQYQKIIQELRQKQRQQKQRQKKINTQVNKDVNKNQFNHKYITNGITSSNIKTFQKMNYQNNHKIHNKSSQQQIFTDSDRDSFQEQDYQQNHTFNHKQSPEQLNQNYDQMNFTDNQEIHSNLGLSSQTKTQKYNHKDIDNHYFPDIPIINSKSSSHSDFNQFTLSKSSDNTVIPPHKFEDNCKEFHLGKNSSTQQKKTNFQLQISNQEKRSLSPQYEKNYPQHQKFGNRFDDIKQSIHQQSPGITKLSGMNFNLYDSIMNFRGSLGQSRNRSFISGDSTIKKGSKLFNKVKSKSIYETFFITGFSLKQSKPIIEYFYPKESNHFKAILDLCFTIESFQCLVKENQNIQSGNSHTHSRFQSNYGQCPSKTNLSNTYRIKDTFVMPIKKQGSSDDSGEIQYLVASQLDQHYFDKNQNNFLILSRLVCFITSCKFFNVFQIVQSQMIQLVNNAIQQRLNKEKQKKSFKWLQNKYSQIVKQTIQDSLKRLFAQNVQDNQYINLSLSQKIKILIDVPPADQSYKMLIQYKQWNILNTHVTVRNLNIFKGPGNSQQYKYLETKLAGIFIVYLLCEVKIILFSNIRSKISQLLLHTFQIIKPLEYVNPIMMAVIRESFQQYLQAPIPIILGFSGQFKKQKQKIQIFMHKKTNSSLSQRIQKGHLSITDGIVINLDTGFIFGGAVQDSLNNLGVQLNSILQIGGMKTTPKHIYTVFQKMLGKNNLKSKTVAYNLSSSYKMDQMTKFWMKLNEKIMNTQLYNYYLQKINFELN